MKIHLTDLAIRKFPNPAKGNIKYWDTKTPGFGVRCTAQTKSFMVMYGKDRKLKTLGRYPELTLSEARRAAIKVFSGAGDTKPVTGLRDACEAYLADCEGRLRATSVKAYHSVLQHASDIRIDQANKSTVKVVTAHEIKTYKALFNWLVRTEVYDRNPFLHLTAKFNKRERVLSNDEIKTLWHYDHQPYTTILKLLLLTGQRRSQIWKFQPEWVKENTIVFPAEIMKNGESHTIPLCPLTEQYLQPFSFNGWSKAKVRLDKHTGLADWTVHDLRRTFATVHAQLGTPIHVVETLLDHRSGSISGVAAIYNRYNYLKEMRTALEIYEQHIQAIIA